MASTIALLEVRLPEVRERRRRLEDELSAVVAQEDAMVSVLKGLEILGAVLTDRQVDGAAPSEMTDLTDEPDVEPVLAEPAAVADVSAAEVPEPQATPTDATVPRAARKRAGAAPVRKAAVKRAATRTATARKATARKAVAAGAPVTGAPDQEAAAVPTPAKKTAARGAAKKAAAEETSAKKTVAKKTVARKAVAKTAEAAEPAPAAQPQPQPDSGPADGSGRKRRTDAKSVLAVLTGTTESLRARQVAEVLGLDGTGSDVNAVRTMLERLAKSGAAQRTGRGLYAATSA
ncbi:hypothetical protein AB0I39_30450 [Kitasatospora purpeofusca]|uniref:hypothetical protein n=1 Tax=Kitasatospora purpeofusca TaxID=67352 RepID=UPI0033EB9ED2